MIGICTHDVEHLVGTKDGITCKNCGKVFATFAELESDRPKPKEQVEEVAEKLADEKPKKATKKGGK